MARYSVSMTVEFEGEIEANSEAEAESLAIYDKTCTYVGVNSIEVDELWEEEEEDEEED